MQIMIVRGPQRSWHRGWTQLIFSEWMPMSLSPGCKLWNLGQLSQGERMGPSPVGPGSSLPALPHCESLATASKWNTLLIEQLSKREKLCLWMKNKQNKTKTGRFGGYFLTLSKYMFNSTLHFVILLTEIRIMTVLKWSFLVQGDRSHDCQNWSR